MLVYADRDGDGHGAPPEQTRVCVSKDTRALPEGFVATGDDCCDRDRDVVAGQRKLFDKSQTSRPDVEPFDYDCSGDIYYSFRETTELGRGGCASPIAGERTFRPIAERTERRSHSRMWQRGVARWLSPNGRDMFAASRQAADERSPLRPMSDVAQLRGGAASRPTGTRQFTASFFVLAGLLASACSIEQRVSGPVALTGEWTTVTPPEPLRVAGKLEQKVCLQIVGTVSDIDLKDGVMLAGQRHVLGGEVIDSEQVEYTLGVGELGPTGVCLYRPPGDTSPGPDFPPNRTIIKLRLRSDPPLQVGEIRWRSYDPF